MTVKEGKEEFTVKSSLGICRIFFYRKEVSGHRVKYKNGRNNCEYWWSVCDKHTNNDGNFPFLLLLFLKNRQTNRDMTLWVLAQRVYRP